MKRLLRICFVLLALCPASFALAQELAYVYIQGDKQTPFYVKLEGTMMERYGKNYCILPQMASGPANIEILFQQNTIPSQKFTILVPDGGQRGFMITNRNGQYFLYDLQQQFYLPAGNSASDDHLPQAGTSRKTVDIAAAAPVAEDTLEEETPAAAPVPEKPVVAKTEKKKKTPKEKHNVFKPADRTKTEESGDLKFIGNMELNNDHGAPRTTTGEVATNSDASAATLDTAMPARTQRLDATFQNSDCPKAMDDAAFEAVYKAMMEKTTDEARIDYLNNQMDRCYLCWHARTLGSLLTEDAARFTFLKKVYPRIADQQSFPLLDDLLRSEVWKNQFQQLIHH